MPSKSRAAVGNWGLSGHLMGLPSEEPKIIASKNGKKPATTKGKTSELSSSSRTSELSSSPRKSAKPR